MKYTLLAILGVGYLVSVLLYAGFLDKPPTEKEQVYSACNRARQEINMFSENYCGALQDDYGLVFSCNNDKCKVIEL